MASEGKDDKVREIAERIAECATWSEFWGRVEWDQAAAEHVLREELAGLLGAARVTAIFAPHNHEPSHDNNGACPKCNIEAALKEYGWPWRKS